jgi:hypothetical protein
VNAQIHPKSSNAYLSLGEGYADAETPSSPSKHIGDPLELNSGNGNAKRMIPELEQQNSAFTSVKPHPEDP